MDFQTASTKIWTVTDTILRNQFPKTEWDHFILPFLVLRRLDCMWTKAYRETKAANPGLSDMAIYTRISEAGGENSPIRVCANKWAQGDKMQAGGGLAWICQHSSNVKEDLTAYIDGFNNDVVALFKDLELLPSERVTSGHIQKLAAKSDNTDLLKSFTTAIIKEFDFSTVASDWMSNLFEDCIRQFNATAAKAAGEHYTPRDAVALLAEMLINGNRPEGEVNFYDPTCGTGGILFTGKEMLEARCKANGTKVNIKLFGQELIEFTRGLAKADMLLRGEDFTNIQHGDTLLKDMHAGKKFRFIGANPPYGVNWKNIEAEVRKEAAKGASGRFPAGCPRTTSEGQLLFLQHMVTKLDDPANNDNGRGSRMAVVMNGNPLFAADAGEGDSNIRGWLLRNDMVEAIVALPREMFFNTGIATYIWVITNKKEGKRKGHVQLIDATGMGTRMPKSQGAKRYELTAATIDQIRKWHQDKVGEETDKRCKMLPNAHFGYYSITIAHPEIIEGVPVFEVEGTRNKVDETGAIVTDAKGSPKREKFSELVSIDKEGYAQMAAAAYQSGKLGEALTEECRTYARQMAAEAMLAEDRWSDDIRWVKVSPHIVRDTERLPALDAPVDALLNDGQALAGINRRVLEEWAHREITALRPRNAPDFKILDVEIGWEIPFTQIFYQYQQPEDPTILAQRVQAMFAGLTLDTSFLPQGGAQ